MQQPIQCKCCMKTYKRTSEMNRHLNAMFVKQFRIKAESPTQKALRIYKHNQYLKSKARKEKDRVI